MNSIKLLKNKFESDGFHKVGEFKGLMVERAIFISSSGFFCEFIAIFGFNTYERAKSALTQPGFFPFSLSPTEIGH